MPVLVLIIFLCSGCVVSRPYAKETTQHTNGTTTVKEMRLTTFAFWPGTQLVDKQRGSIGKTVSLGQSGIEQESGGTNMVEALKVISEILGRIH